MDNLFRLSYVVGMVFTFMFAYTSINGSKLTRGALAAIAAVLWPCVFCVIGMKASLTSYENRRK